MPHPLVFLPLHLGNIHFIARAFSHKAIVYPLLMTLGFLQFLLEHYPLVLAPKSEILYAPVTGIFFLVLISFFVVAYRKAAQKTKPVASIIAFVVQTAIFIALQGPPPDTLEANTAAVQDQVYLQGHLVGHAVFVCVLALGSWDVPWDEPKDPSKRSA